MIKQKYLWKALLTTSLITGAANANDCFGACDPCEMDSCFGGFEIGVDFLYWKTCKDDLTYGVVVATTPAPVNEGDPAASVIGKTANLHLDWKPGFRIRASIDDVLGNWDLFGSYTWISTSHNSFIFLPASQPTDTFVTSIQQTYTFNEIRNDFNIYGDIDSIDATFDLTFQSFDVLFAGNYALKQCHYFNPYFGATGIFLHQKLELESDITTLIYSSENKWDDHYDGYGLKIGSQYTLALCDGFSIFGNGAALITVGNHTSTYAQNINNIDDTVAVVPPTKLDHEECIFVPGYQISAGLEFDGCICDFEYEITVAYEFQNYFNVPNAPQFFSENALFVSTSTTISNLGFHGLTAGINVKF